MLGRTIGKYRVVEQIGRGGMGTVYKAIDETLDRTVAIKVLNGDVLEQESIERFRREAMTLAKLNHPRIGAIHELTRDGHDLLMVMEFLEGETCERLIEKGSGTPLSIGRAVQICSQALEALQYAHSAGIVHRDLKPANIIIAPNGDVKLMDFGIARVQGSEHLTSHGFMVGTPAYMSPEQVRGEEVDPRMDLYAIAVVLYRLLTNHLPFAGDTAIAMIHSQLANQPTPAQQFRSDLPDWVTSVLTRGLAKAAKDRFQTAAEFRGALEAGLTGKMAVFAAPAVEDMDVTRGPMLTPPAMPVPQSMPAMSGSGREMIPSGILAIPPQPQAPPAATNHAPVPGPAANPQPTVTLRAPHLAGAAVLVVLLVIGVTVLAMIAFRRSSSPGTPASTSAAAPSPAATPITPEATTPATPAATTPPDVTPPAPSPSATPAVTTPAAAGPATTATTPATATGRGAASPAATTGSATVAAPTAGRGDAPAGRRGGAPATTPPASTAASSPAPPATPAAPAAADAPTENFGTIRAFVPDGTKSKEVESLLSLEPGTLIVRNRGDGSVLRSLTYRQVAAATYTRGRRPRSQSVPGAVNVPENFAGGGVFGASRHWLILQTSSEFLVLRLEDRNVIGVLKSIEARTGLKVQRDQDN